MAKKVENSSKRATETGKERKKRGPKKGKRITSKDATRNSGLKKRFFSRIKQEYHDIDYVLKLNEEEQAWLSSFMNEDLGAQFNHQGKAIYKSKEKKKEAYRRNNARNRDEYSRLKAMGRTVDIPEHLAYQYWEENYVNEEAENDVIDKIESSEKNEILTLEEYNNLKDKLTDEVKEFYQKYYKL